MASIKNLGDGKYRAFFCNGTKPDGKPNRFSKVITAKSRRDAEKQAQAIEVDFKRGNLIQASCMYTFTELVNNWREIVKPDMVLKTQERYERMQKRFNIHYLVLIKI